jgi:hypothetical protein
MIWSSVIVAGVCGGIAGGVAALIISRDENPMGFLVVGIVLFAVLNFGARTFLLPELRAWEAGGAADQVIAGNKTLAVLAEKRPEVRVQLVSLLQDLGRRGASEETARREGTEFGRKVLSKYLAEFGPTASPESLTSYASALATALDDVASQSDDACADLVLGSGNDVPQLGPADRTKLDEAIAGVIESALSSPEPPLRQEQAQQGMRALLASLQNRYGPAFLPRLAVFSHPDAPGVDKHLICDTARKFYQGALDLPPADAPLAIRAIFAGTARHAS